MHCSNVNHFKQIAPEKTINRMSLVVLDIECFENKIVKELGVFKDGQIVGFLFLPRKKIQTIIPIFLVYKTSSWNQYEQQLQKLY